MLKKVDNQKKSGPKEEQKQRTNIEIWGIIYGTSLVVDEKSLMEDDLADRNLITNL